MKKRITLVLALLMVVSLSTAAFASEAGNAVAEAGALAATNEGGDSSSIPVNGVCLPPGYTTEATISADITWGAMECTYRVETQGEWNPESHSYGEAAEPTWSYNGNEITVTNHSDVEIRADFSFTPMAGLAITGQFSEDVLLLASAVQKNYTDAPSGTTEFTIASGSIAQTMDQMGVIYVNIGRMTCTEVSTEEELRTAIASTTTEPVYIKMKQNIVLNDTMTIAGPAPCVIDLGRQTLTINGTDGAGALQIEENGDLTLMNGFVSSTITHETGIRNKGRLVMENGALTTENAYCALDTYGPTVIKNFNVQNYREPVQNQEPAYAIIVYETELVLEGDITFNGAVGATTNGKVKLLVGTYQYDADSAMYNSGSPNMYAYIDEELYTITDNGNSSWTVTAK